MKIHDIISDNLRDILIWFSANDYEPWETKAQLASFQDWNQITAGKQELRQIIDKRLWSQRFYLGLTGFEFKSEDDFYTYLEEVFQYVFNDGPLPDIEKYWY